MEKIVRQVRFDEMPPQRKRVAAYARVSTGKDAMLHSLSVQVSTYSKMIQSRPDWQYVGVYADEAVTGTKEDRAQFRKMLADCKDGKIDMILTKSISRFARNTVTLLETVRELKAIGVDVYFEEQNIYTVSAEGEVMLAILASYAQEESRSVSENQKWRIRRNFEQGIPWCRRMFGYRLVGERYETVPEEAAIVRRIYSEYLSGNGLWTIAKGLNRDGYRTLQGNEWSKNAVGIVLRNVTYTGNLLLQRYYKDHHITKRKTVNRGELPKYSVENTHAAIIGKETFQAVQEEISRRTNRYYFAPAQKQYPFTGLITCGVCGKHYVHSTAKSGVYWICSTNKAYGKSQCASIRLPEKILTELTADIAVSDIKEILAFPDRTVQFCLKNGNRITKEWHPHSRSESWTDEMKEQARMNAKRRKKQ